MRCKEFYDLQHIKSYLQSSIIWYDKRPALITQIGQGDRATEYMLQYYRLPEAKNNQRRPRLINYPSDAIDLTPVPLGMVDFGKNVYHVSRLPARQWKVGLCANNISLVPVLGGGYRGVNQVLYSQEMENTILGNYKTLDQILGSEAGQGAFSRRFAIKKTDVYYRTRGKVGKVNTDNGKITLDNTSFFLNEVLEEDLNGRKDYRPAQSGGQAAAG